MKAVEDAKGHGNVAEQGPDGVTIELGPCGDIGVALDLHGVPEVDSQVADQEEGEDVSTRPTDLVLAGVAAPPQAVHNHRCLDHHLNQLE